MAQLTIILPLLVLRVLFTQFSDWFWHLLANMLGFGAFTYGLNPTLTAHELPHVGANYVLFNISLHTSYLYRQQQ